MEKEEDVQGELGLGEPYTKSSTTVVKKLECGCEPPCTCELPSTTSLSRVKSSKKKLAAEGSCVCDPCDCDPPTDPTAPCVDEPCGGCGQAEDAPCNVDPCACDLPVAVDGPCVCDPCECDVPVDKDGPCVCDPCECDPELAKGDPCTCDPCECDPPFDKNAPCICNPCECDVPIVCDECTCDPCTCEPPQDARDCVTPPIDPFDEPFLEKLQQNLLDNQKRTCHELKPRVTGARLTEDLLLHLLLKDNRGKAIMYLPGNQVYPAILRRRICDEDMEAIVNVLLEVRAVTTLNLAYNNITDVGIEFLAPTLQECANIEHVNLMQNDITSSGVLTLCKALMHRSPLLTLRLSGVKFGVEGINALTCLIMCGRVPLDLDISECDMTVEGFQTLCTAFHAVDHDLDFPNFLLTKDLPIDLASLKEAKEEYNEEISQVSEMNKKLAESERFYNIPKTFDDDDELPEEELLEGRVLPEVMEQFSATLLQGLFDIRQSLEEPSIIETPADDIIPQSRVKQIMEEAKHGLAEMDDFIKELDTIRHQDKYGEYETDFDVPIVSESLYSLTAHEDLDASNFDGVKGDFVTDRHMQLFHGQIIDTAQLVLLDAIEVMAAPDEFTAQNAAIGYVDGLIEDAAEVAATTEMTDKSDVIQLVLMTIVDMVYGAQLEKNMTGDHSDFTEQELNGMMEKAVDRMTNLLLPEIPPTCELSEEMVRDFVRSFFATTKGTFTNVLQNPFILKALIREGTLACQHKAVVEEEARLNPTAVVAMTEEQIRHLATQFLSGAINEAARLVGTGDPFGYRLQRKTGSADSLRGSDKDDQDSLESDDQEEYVLDSLLNTENCLTETIEQLIDTSAKLAVSTKINAEGVEKAKQDYDEAANIFVEDLFLFVQNAVAEREIIAQNFTLNVQEEGDARMPRLLYEYVSRPTRLALNRPIFNHHQELMGSKLGDYLQNNYSIKVLHIQKWQLGEEGMRGLMEGLMYNKTLVILDLANNELGADGMKLLGVYLGKNHNLKHLILNHNRLRDPGILNLVDHITESNLRTLNIAFNNLTAVGLDPLLMVIPSTKISSLYLWGNVFGLETWDLMKGLLDENIVQYSDTLLQAVGDQRCIVKNSQVRDTNFWYDVPPVIEDGLIVPPYLLEQPHRHVEKQLHLPIVPPPSAE